MACCQTVSASRLAQLQTLVQTRAQFVPLGLKISMCLLSLFLVQQGCGLFGEASTFKCMRAFGDRNRYT